MKIYNTNQIFNINFKGNEKPARIPVKASLDSFKISDPATAFELKAINIANLILSPNAEITDELFEKINKVIQLDPYKQELDQLSEQYIKDKTIKNKIALLEQEEKMLWQELEKPEIGLVRNFLETGFVCFDPEQEKEKMLPAITSLALNGLAKIQDSLRTLEEDYKENPNKLKILKKAHSRTNNDSHYSSHIKNMIGRINRHELYRKEKINPQNPYTTDFSKQVSEEDILKVRNKKEFPVSRNEALKFLALAKCEKIKDDIPEIILDNNAHKILRKTALWSAGRVQSDSSFMVLKMFAKNKEKDSELREMAIHSLALYNNKNNKPQIKEILNNIINENSELSELAQVLSDKLDRKFNKADHELNKLGLDENQKSEYKKTKKGYLTSQKDLNVQNKNLFDRALAPFSKALKKIVEKGSKAYILKDTATYIENAAVGKRHFMQDVTYSGAFLDSVTGVNHYLSDDKSNLIIHKSKINDISKENVLAHEFNHNFLRNLLDKQDTMKVKELYENAKKKDLFMDNYAAVNFSEYFAQGYEAYSTVYKPHIFMIENDSIENSRTNVKSTLKRKDPELFNFIEYCIKKYNKD